MKLFILLFLSIGMFYTGACDTVSTREIGTFTEADVLLPIVVDVLPDNFIRQNEAIQRLNEADDYVEFYIWKNSTGIIDWKRRNESDIIEYTYDTGVQFNTSIQDANFIVIYSGDGLTYVNWQIFSDFLNMLQIQFPLE